MGVGEEDLIVNFPKIGREFFHLSTVYREPMDVWRSRSPIKNKGPKAGPERKGMGAYIHPLKRLLNSGYRPFGIHVPIQGR